MEGKCALCRNCRPLQNSHFYPKFVYRIVNSIKKKGTEKTLISQNGEAQSLFREIKKYLLCNDCEKKFSRGGENGFAKLFAPCKDGGTQLLYNYAKGLYDRELYSCHTISGVSNKEVIYFATSIFWRATFEWYGYQSLKLDDGLVYEMECFLRDEVYPESYIIMSVPINMIEQYSFVFPKKYERKDIFNGDFFYFTMFSHCFILMSRGNVCKYIGKDFKDKVCHLNSFVLQRGIMKEFLRNYRQKKHREGMKYSTEVEWMKKHIYNTYENHFTTFKEDSSIYYLIEKEGVIKYWEFIVETGRIDYSEKYLNYGGKSDKT